MQGYGHVNQATWIVLRDPSELKKKNILARLIYHLQTKAKNIHSIIKTSMLSDNLHDTSHAGQSMAGLVNPKRARLSWTGLIIESTAFLLLHNREHHSHLICFLYSVSNLKKNNYTFLLTDGAVWLTPFAMVKSHWEFLFLSFNSESCYHLCQSSIYLRPPFTQVCVLYALFNT